MVLPPYHMEVVLTGCVASGDTMFVYGWVPHIETNRWPHFCFPWGHYPWGIPGYSWWSCCPWSGSVCHTYCRPSWCFCIGPGCMVWKCGLWPCLQWWWVLCQQCPGYSPCSSLHCYGLWTFFQSCPWPTWGTCSDEVPSWGDPFPSDEAPACCTLFWPCG